MADVSVLVLNYNGCEFIRPCLDSVLAQECVVREVIVVDNASPDGSARIVAADFPQVRLVESKQNLGFAGGMNLGIKQSSSELILLLNNDVVLEPGFLSAMIEAIESDRRIGSVSGKIFKMARRQERILDTTGHIIFRNRLFTDRGDGEPDAGQYDEVEEVFGACAGAGLYRREMLEDTKIGEEYFDESFFMFLEDTDLNWRAQLRGWKCLYTPEAIAWHWRGGTALRRSKLVETHNFKNRYMMIIKNDSGLSLLRSVQHFLVTDIMKSAALLWRCPSALLGWFDVWWNLPALLRKRRIIQGGRTVGRKEFERWFQPFDYKAWIGRHLRGK